MLIILMTYQNRERNDESRLKQGHHVPGNQRNANFNNKESVFGAVSLLFNALQSSKGISNYLHFGESIITKENQHSKDMHAPVLMLTLLNSIFNEGNNPNVQHQMHGCINDAYLLQEAICRPASPVSMQDSYSLDSENLSQTPSKGPSTGMRKALSIHQSWNAQQEAHPGMRGTSRPMMKSPEKI